MPDQWEDTTGMKDSGPQEGFKVIKSGSPFHFYWVNDEIEIIKHRDDKAPYMGFTYGFLGFWEGLVISFDQNIESRASVYDYFWVLP